MAAALGTTTRGGQPLSSDRTDQSQASRRRTSVKNGLHYRDCSTGVVFSGTEHDFDHQTIESDAKPTATEAPAQVSEQRKGHMAMSVWSPA